MISFKEIKEQWTRIGSDKDDYRYFSHDNYLLVGANAVIHDSVVFGCRVKISSDVYIEADTVIGDATTISRGVYIGQQVKIGRLVSIGTNSRVADECVIGNACNISHSVRIGFETKLCAKVVLSSHSTISNQVLLGLGVIIGRSVVVGYGVHIGPKSSIVRYSRLAAKTQLCSTDRYITIGPIGSRQDILTAIKTRHGALRFYTGCFGGSLAEFAAAVKKTHGTNRNGKAYIAAMKFVKTCPMISATCKKVNT